MTIREFNNKTELVRKDDCISASVRNVDQFHHTLKFTGYNNLIVFVQQSWFEGGVVEILKILREKLDNTKYKYDICDIGAINKAIVIYKVKN